MGAATHPIANRTKTTIPSQSGVVVPNWENNPSTICRQALLQTALGSRKAREKRQRTPSPQRLEEISRALSCAKGGSGSDPWADVGHQVSVDPVDDAGINVSNLEERWDLGVPGTTINPDHISHTPAP